MARMEECWDQNDLEPLVRGRLMAVTGSPHSLNDPSPLPHSSVQGNLLYSVAHDP